MNIHVIMPFSRFHLIDELIRHYEPMNVILHPVVFASECSGNSFPVEYSWIRPLVVPDGEGDNAVFPGVAYYKCNQFLECCRIENDDYYCFAADDGGYEPCVFDAIRKRDEDVIFISLKRGDRVPDGLPPERRYDVNTLVASPDNVRIGAVSGEQYIMKGHVLKTVHFDSDQCADGRVAEYLKDSFPCLYLPNLYALFNWFEPGRWNKQDDVKVSFGALVNDMMRLDMCLKQSALPGKMNFFYSPESATKGLNRLLDAMDMEGADIGILTHQDMCYRQGWLDLVKKQIALLPDSWVVAGIIGKDLNGKICGRFHDMRIAPIWDTSDIHTFPHPASCFDECCIIVNMKKDFRFDEQLEGFDLYGTMAVLQAREMGGTAWIIDAFAEHYCMRPFTWVPDALFCQNFKWLHNTYPNAARIDSTAIGVPDEDHPESL